MHKRWITVVTVVIVASTALASCGGGGSEEAEPKESTTTAEASGPAVELMTETFVDPSRPTEDAAGPGADDRTLETRIAHPTSGGPYPLIVLSHGFGGHPDEYEQTIQDWAADGFVVAAPAFPLTNDQNPTQEDNLLDVNNQPDDVSFVIDEVLAANEDEDSALHGLVDPDAIGAVGHSLGGATTWAASFHTGKGDDRIDSTVIFAGVVIEMEGGELDFADGPPLLVFHGDADDVPMDMGRNAYEEAGPPKWYVTLHGATHVPAFTDDTSPHDDLVNRTVLDFWHGTLDGDDAALDRVTDDATDPELSTVDHE
ncbi:alpha/beta hydrolase family protein [Aquihabitans daechungensis]|uniref:alpha/beta hydrolase family protein n=1 Tax=Aquihabitans daechungensis TaxID=1052257 RepID=UPI003B9F4E7A